MSPEEKELLKRTLKLTEDNNEILRSMQRSMRLQRIARIIYWVFIIGGALGAYYLIQPYVEALVSTYGGVSETFSSIFN